MLSIQTNMLAWNASRQYKINTKKNSRNVEKLSSGYKINRAADDAAGLSISEKMRRQIRGLKQGSDNIQDGISLIQVADGAMGEVVDILQRINELSVKAYNDTNTQDDREYIQGEVSHLIKEIERIADTTTFNEIEVLKGNPTKMVKIEADQIYTGSLTRTVECEVPEWLKAGIDDKLELHAYRGLTQDTDGWMYKVTNVVDGHITEGVYYGPTDEGKLFGVYTYGGIWTDTLNDNPTAKISFSELAKCDDAVTLYNNMLNLLGCAVGVPCGTCDSIYYGIGFDGEEEGYSAHPGYYINSAHEQISIGARLNVSEWKDFVDNSGSKVNCFDKIKELIEEQNSNDNLTDSQKKADTQKLAEEIARKLCAKTYEKLTNITDYKDHFDRALTDGVYDIIVYDYRDEGRLASLHAADAKVNISAVGTVEIPYSYLVPGTEVEMEEPLWIVCSAQSPDKVPIDLPLLTTEALGITGYDVSRYKVVETYSDSYRAKIEAWENDFHYETVTVPEHKVSVTKTELISSVPVFNENGEWRGMDQQYKETTQEVVIPESSYQKKVQNNPRPVPTEGDIIRTVMYSPDSNRQIKDALAYVLKCRTTLGAEQNRLEHAYNNNQNKYENITSSESVIRDTDMMDEMVAYSNNNILLQAGASILSQANQSSQMILQLLQ